MNYNSDNSKCASIITGNITTAVPYTKYTVKLEACTSGGCTESKDGVNVFTKEEGEESCLGNLKGFFKFYIFYFGVEYTELGKEVER
jgi:hypothetical protein